VEVALAAAPGHRTALAAKKTALEHLQVAGGGTNLSETMWLRAELAEVEQQLAAQAAPVA
jgi:hypothetical protein